MNDNIEMKKCKWIDNLINIIQMIKKEENVLYTSYWKIIEVLSTK